MLAQYRLLAALRTATLLLTLVAAGSGCAALHANPSMDLTDASVVPASEGGTKTAAISLEVRASRGRPETQQLPLQGAMHVQDVLEQTNLTRRFRRMEIHVMRPIDDTLARLDIRYEHQAGRVDPLYDYALHPGDHLVVIEDTSTILTDMLDSLPNPLGPSRQR